MLRRLERARSSIVPTPPSSTVRPAASAKPRTCSSVIRDGIDSALESVISSTSAGPFAASASRSAPSISPGKSWEGAIGGGIAVLILATLSIVLGGDAMAGTFAARVQAVLGWPVLYAVLILIVAASVVGDLFESLLKRHVGAKDSGDLIPGHGGILDRIDSVLAALPVFALGKGLLGF